MEIIFPFFSFLNLEIHLIINIFHYNYIIKMDFRIFIIKINYFLINFMFFFLLQFLIFNHLLYLVKLFFFKLINQ